MSNNRHKLLTDSGECVYADANGKSLHRNMFNLEWVTELGITPNVVYDIGSYDFGDSIRFKQKFPNSKIYAFELLKSNFDKFSPYAKKCGINCYNYAISHKSRQCIEFWESVHNEGVNAQSSVLEPGKIYKENYGGYVNHYKCSYQVWSETVNSFSTRNGIVSIDVMMIDAEGCEHNIIENFGKMRPKLIFAEFLLNCGWISQPPLIETVKLLNNMGYEEIFSDLSFDKIFIYKY